MTTADETYDFTEREFKVIFALCLGLSREETARRCGITEQAVMVTRISIYDKTGVAALIELVEFVKTALNGELRRRKKE